MPMDNYRRIIKGYEPKEPTTMLSGFSIVVGTLGVFIGLVLNVISKVISRNEDK